MNGVKKPIHIEPTTKKSGGNHALGFAQLHGYILRGLDNK